MNASEVLPAQFNVAAWFVDRNVAEGRGASPAFLFEDRTLTYADVQELVNRTGNALLELGVEMEHRVLMLCLDAPEFIGTFWGAIKIGAIPIPVNTLMRTADYLYFLNDSRAKVAVISAPLLAGEALLRLRARQLRLLPDERGRAERALPAPADAGVGLRNHRALPPDALLRRADALRRHARGQGRRGAVRHLVAAALRVGGRGAARRDLQALARALRCGDHRRDRYDRDLPCLHLEPSRPGASRLLGAPRAGLRARHRGRRGAPRGAGRDRQPPCQGRLHDGVLLEQAREDQRDSLRRVDPDGRQVLPGQGRLLLVLRPLGRHAESRRDLGLAGRGRGDARAPSGRARGRGGRQGGHRPARQAEGVRRPEGVREGLRGARERAQGIREGQDRALQVPALDRVR